MYRLDKANVLDLSANLKHQEVYHTFFNGNFGPGFDERRHNGVGYAAFNDAYYARHHPIQGIDYKGNRKFFQLVMLFSISQMLSHCVFNMTCELS